MKLDRLLLICLSFCHVTQCMEMYNSNNSDGYVNRRREFHAYPPVDDHLVGGSLYDYRTNDNRFRQVAILISALEKDSCLGEAISQNQVVSAVKKE